jgi:hypothetical protein
MDQKTLSIWVKPGDVEAAAPRQNVEQFTTLIEYWKQGLNFART